MTSSAAITLHLAAGNTIVALPSSERHRWATTALELAGFTRHQGKAHQLPLGDHAHARATLTQLHETARDCQAKVITSERPYLGDIAVVVAEILPGSWEVEVEHYPDGSIPAHLLEWVWEAAPALSALSKSRIPCAAILRDGDGTELLLAERPWNDTYLVGTLLPSPDHVHVVGTGAPRTSLLPPPTGRLPTCAHASCRSLSSWCSWRGFVKCSRTCAGCETLRPGPWTPWTWAPRWSDSSSTRPT
ncbi:hypothetical protein LRE75_36450 [Streptomyces sp. 372A]